jgi:hypothetical protein
MSVLHAQIQRVDFAVQYPRPSGPDREHRLRQLEQLSEEVEGFIFDLRSQLPEPRSRRGDPPRI